MRNFDNVRPLQWSRIFVVHDCTSRKPCRIEFENNQGDICLNVRITNFGAICVSLY